ncbi:hypothetical protein [Vogesella sp. LIG4]|uniref:hypothetical protein n=1 Tax=Vogesella sp. LIG4 TaxID=1192162 RepID=UPI000B5ADB44|nr:hypothetical protein [Vogesella sp. LIG4]
MTALADRLSEPQTPDLIGRPIASVGYGLYGTVLWKVPPQENRVFVGFDDSMPGLWLNDWFDAHLARRQQVLCRNELATKLWAAGEG